eukprot:TRINITY_DN17478_c0_g1_i1.p1 TRINITY_DN17478_c0_g1~~TRINITY_DN17478_c0_g1_i1.p1  ORF type:complete len:368 (+),score=64.84 TRINITY_DN17478_c0_g1_i1:68-1105(+)
MGGCLTSEGGKRSELIDIKLRDGRRRRRNEVKMLLLGSGESGKSTIFKQMKLIQDNGGFSDDELDSYKFIIFGNCVNQMKVIVNAGEKLKTTYDSEMNQKRVEKLLAIPPGGDSWTMEVGVDIKHLWADSGIQRIYALRDKEFQLNDSASYFFDNIERFMAPGYVPTMPDVLRARVRSTGIEEAEFTLGDIIFRMVDVGGQRSERRKWMHCFDDVEAILFCASLSEYDQVLREDETQNRMKESLLLFDEVCNSHYFRNTTFILFLNKVDLFKEKIKRVDLSTIFENYSGGDDFEAASQFIRSRFLEQNQSPHQIYTHFTCAINTESIELVFKTVREIIVKKSEVI